MTCLEVGTTRVYREKIPSDISSLQMMATGAERCLVANVKSLHRQAEMMLTRIMLREIFGDDVVYFHNENGAPMVSRDCNISVSHCADEVVIAVDEMCHIGIDVELWRGQLHRVAPRVLSVAELAYYNAPQGLLRAWTAKEAIYKAVALPGLDFVSEINLPVTDGATIALAERGGIAKKVELFYVELSPEKVVTLARCENM